MLIFTEVNFQFCYFSPKDDQGWTIIDLQQVYPSVVSLFEFSSKSKIHIIISIFLWIKFFEHEKLLKLPKSTPFIHVVTLPNWTISRVYHIIYTRLLISLAIKKNALYTAVNSCLLIVKQIRPYRDQSLTSWNQSVITEAERNHRAFADHKK